MSAYMFKCHRCNREVIVPRLDFFASQRNPVNRARAKLENKCLGEYVFVKVTTHHSGHS